MRLVDQGQRRNRTQQTGDPEYGPSVQQGGDTAQHGRDCKQQECEPHQNPSVQ
jgi:hypothetical protein